MVLARCAHSAFTRKMRKIQDRDLAATQRIEAIEHHRQSMHHGVITVRRRKGSDVVWWIAMRTA